MTVSGGFSLERTTYHRGDPIPVTLQVCNDSDRDVFVFIPHGRANGIRVEVVDGDGLQVASLEREPEPGLVGERRIAAGDCEEQSFPLDQWLDVHEPGKYVLECTVELELADASLRDSARQTQIATMVSRLELAIEP
jgi:hypothetical protein